MDEPGRENSPILEGLKDATNKLKGMLDALGAPRAGDRIPAKDSLAQAINLIIGFTKTGKTTLLTWMEVQAQKQNICVVRRPSSRTHRFDSSFGDFIAAHFEPRTLHTITKALIAEKSGAKTDDETKEERSYEKAVRNIVSERPLLLLLDQANEYSLTELEILMSINSEIIHEGKPLAMVLAGMPRLDNLLNMSKSASIARDQKIYLSTLSDDAARKVLSTSFKRKGISFSKKMLNDIAAQTDNHPYFVGKMEEAICEELDEAKSQEISPQIFSKASKKAMRRREILYGIPYISMRDGGLLDHARQVLELVEENDGNMSLELLVNTLAKTPIGRDVETSKRICRVMGEHGVIWIVDGAVQSCMPSLYSYLKLRNSQ